MGMLIRECKHGGIFQTWVYESDGFQTRLPRYPGLEAVITVITLI